MLASSQHVPEFSRIFCLQSLPSFAFIAESEMVFNECTTVSAIQCHPVPSRAYERDVILYLLTRVENLGSSAEKQEDVDDHSLRFHFSPALERGCGC